MSAAIYVIAAFGVFVSLSAKSLPRIAPGCFAGFAFDVDFGSFVWLLFQSLPLTALKSLSVLC